MKPDGETTLPAQRAWTLDQDWGQDAAPAPAERTADPASPARIPEPDTGTETGTHPKADPDTRPTVRIGPNASADAATPTTPLPDADTGHRRTLSLAALLRGTGAALIIAAFVMILFQGWRDGDALTRGLMLLGQTLALTLAGFASGHLLHEPKGARLFIALALAVVPVSFAFLGAITAPHWGLTLPAPRALLPEAWVSTASAMGTQAALLFTAVALMLLAVAVRIGFLIMARRSSGALTALYLLANLALLVPSRDGVVIAGLLLALALVLGTALVKLARGDSTLTTPEGLFARLVLWLPLLVLAGRNIWLYAPDQTFYTSLSLLGYVIVRQGLVALAADRRRTGPLEVVAVLLAGLSNWLVFSTLIELPWLDQAFGLPIAAGLFSLLLLDLSRVGSTRARVYRATAAGTIAAAMTLNLLAFSGIVNAVATIAVGIAVLAHGHSARLRSVLVLGTLCVLAGLGSAGHAVLTHVSIGGWTALVLLGIVAMVAGSTLERHGARLKAAVIDWNRRFGAPAP